MTNAWKKDCSSKQKYLLNMQLPLSRYNTYPTYVLYVFANTYTITNLYTKYSRYAYTYIYLHDVPHLNVVGLLQTNRIQKLEFILMNGLMYGYILKKLSVFPHLASNGRPRNHCFFLISLGKCLINNCTSSQWITISESINVLKNNNNK